MPGVISGAPAPDLAVPPHDRLASREEGQAMAVTAAAIIPSLGAALTTVRALCRPTSAAAAAQGRAAVSAAAAVPAAAPSNCTWPDVYFWMEESALMAAMELLREAAADQGAAYGWTSAE